MHHGKTKPVSRGELVTGYRNRKKYMYARVRGYVRYVRTQLNRRRLLFFHSSTK